MRIRISDNGVGMDHTTKQQIFDPVFTTKDVSKGTGLGLSTAYAIVQDHSGRIEVETSPATGTSFAVYLPVVPGISPPNSQEEEIDVEGGTETILVIDDEPGIREILSIMLKKRGTLSWPTTTAARAWNSFANATGKSTWCCWTYPCQSCRARTH